MNETTRFCPECGSEYRPEITVCPACERELVAAEEIRQGFPEPEYDNTPTVTVLETGDLGTLELARSLLAEAGIGCSIRNERMLGLFPALQAGSTVTQRFRSAELQVTERNAARARALLEELEHAELVDFPADDDPEADEQP